MADLGRMTIEELASKVIADEHGDWLREAVAFLADALMEAEVEQVCGAAYRERSPERVTQRNGPYKYGANVYVSLAGTRRGTCPSGCGPERDPAARP